jgi:DNA replication and repair protein RecF
MHLAHIFLEQFRCYSRQELELPPAGIRLAGSNASGKTSFVEAIQLLSMMKSARAGIERELINWESNAEFGLPPFARVQGWIEGATRANSIEIVLTVDPNRPNHTKKQIKLDGQAKRAIDAVGQLKTVLFEPEDMDLILGSPSVRRRYLDVAISTLDHTYLRLLSQYNKILEQRNSLLKSFREQPVAARSRRSSELDYWDSELINRAAYIVAARLRFLDQSRKPLQRAFQSLLGEDHELGIEYAISSREASATLLSGVMHSEFVETQRQVSRLLQEELDARRSEEFSRGVTAIGPHRDDLNILLDGRDIESFGSRGQQRMAVVSAKLAEIDVIYRSTGETAVLLLDDVLSELDGTRRQRLLSLVGEQGGQVIVTATDASLLEAEQLEGLPLYHVEDGKLSREV